MKILLCAYHEAGYRVLRYLMERRHDIAVATHAAPPEWPNVAALARSYSLTTTVDDPQGLVQIAHRFKPDVIFSVYYRHIIPQEILILPESGAYNFHPSLLPRHRGCFSAPWAIIEGDRETGVTCHTMTPNVDAGDIIDLTVVNIDDTDTGLSLYYKLVDATVALFPRVLDSVLDGRTAPKPQSDQASYHKRSVPFGGVIDPSWPRVKIERFIRAMYFPPFPSATVLRDGRRHPVRSLGEYDTIMEQCAPFNREAQHAAVPTEHPNEPVVTISK